MNIMPIRLKPMTDIKFSEYLENAISSYACENVDSGRWLEQGAIERSREDHEQLLPEGVNTKNNYLFEILSEADECSVGIVWLALEDKYGVKTAFIYDIEVKPAFRRKGYARSALLELESLASKQGIGSIGLHVFRQNSAAQNLYKAMGYSVVSSNMVKSIL
jgi:ribosomal protein S18 acetylase RimI-like enzyme